MAITKTQIASFVSPEEFSAVVLDVEKYPEFLPEVKRVKINARTATSMNATFYVSIAFAGFKVDTEYTLDYAIDGHVIRWKLASSPDITKNEGEWRLEATSDGETLAHYQSEITTSLPVPPEVQNAFAESEMPKLMEKFRDRVEG